MSQHTLLVLWLAVMVIGVPLERWLWRWWGRREKP
jgi:hypothetical protein